MPSLIISCKLFVQDRLASGAQLSPVHIFSLHLYTLYCSIFRDSNRAMRSLEWDQILVWRPFIWYLDQALYQLNTSSSTVFRGLKLRGTDGTVGSFLDAKWPKGMSDYTRQQTPKYYPDHIVLWPAFSSTSLDYRIALGYASRELQPDEAAVILKIQTQRAKPVQNFSYYPFERELLYAPNSAFRITGLWEPSSFNLRQGVQTESGGLFTVNIDELTQGMLSLDEARNRREVLITMVEEVLDPELETLNAKGELDRRKYFDAAHGDRVPSVGATTTHTSKPAPVPPCVSAAAADGADTSGPSDAIAPNTPCSTPANAETLRAYYEMHANAIEEDLSDAVNTVMESQCSDPLTAIAQLLLRKAEQQKRRSA
jgi:hypothetical protein